MDKHTIIRLKQEGISNRQIAKEMGIDRKTVARYWNEFQEALITLSEEDKDIGLIQEKIAAEPKYDSSNRKRRKYTKALDEYIDTILANEKIKDKTLGFHKQKLTYRQIYEMVISKGFDISLGSVSHHIKIKRDKAKECFIRQQYDFGDRLEYDFGEVKLVVDGELDTYHMAVFSSPASDFRWAYLYKSQKNDVFMDSQIRFFDMIGGIYKEVVYDNMRNVVSKFIGKNEKELHPNLLIISNYYGFHINVTNCFSGNEKGHVEGSVKIIRNAVFAKKYKFDSFEQAEEYLEKRLLEINQNSEIKEEVKHLGSLKPTFELAKMTEQKVNSYSFVQVEKNRYSVPDYLVGKIVTIRTYVKEIKIYANHQLICTHKKKDGTNEVSIDIQHYLPSLARKPGALRNSAALKSIPLLKSIFDHHFSKNPRKFIELLIENQEKNQDELLDVFNRYLALGNKVIPMDNFPVQNQVTIKTKGIISAYDQLKIGGLNLDGN